MSRDWSECNKTPLIFVEKEDDTILPVLQKEKNLKKFFNLKNIKLKIKGKKYTEMIHVHVPSLSSCLSDSSYITTRSILYLTVHLLRIYLTKETRIIHK